MNMLRFVQPRRSLAARLMLFFVALLLAFMLILSVLYNALMRSQSIRHYSQSMQRDAHTISQNLSGIFLPADGDALDENRFIVSRETLAPYMALIEQVTSCNVYLIDTYHNVTGYFDGVVQTVPNPLLPGYIEQAIALGFIGKTPVTKAELEGETHLTACMPVMNDESKVLGVVLLETTLRELGFAQVPSATILLTSCLIASCLAVFLASFFSHGLMRPIASLERVAQALADGEYQTRTCLTRKDELGSLAHSMDILAQRLEEARAQEERVRAQQQAFFSNISHELKTPVTVIRGSLEALNDGVVSADADVRAYYAQMIKESRWLQRLIQDLLELSRLQSLDFSLEKKPVDLRELLGDVAMSAGALCERKGVRFACEEPRRSFTVMGDYTRLRQMLLAVVDNAIKFTQPGKQVCLALEADAPVIRIADEGAGIAQEEIEHIFDRFRHTRDSAQESTGLGLAIVREIARRHQVEISVRSEIGRGTVFTFRFSAEEG